MPGFHVVSLHEVYRPLPDTMTAGGLSAARTVTRARILLLSDTDESDPDSFLP